MSIVTVYLPSPHNAFLYFLEGQVHKDNKLGIMTNVGKSRLVKVILTNIHKISDACANSFGRYIMIAQCMRNVFTFHYINSSFWKNGVSKKIKTHSSRQLPGLQQLFSPHLFNFIQKIVSPIPILKRGQKLHSISEITKERQ